MVVRNKRKYFIVTLFIILFIKYYSQFLTLTHSLNSIEIELEGCNCSRTLKTFDLNPNVPYNHTTCGRDAYYRGPHQNVASFTFYGDVNSKTHLFRQFFHGIEENAALLKEFYNETWVMRLYYDIDPDSMLHNQLCEIACYYDNLDLCNIRKLPGNPGIDARDIFAMNWRFFPTLDPQVDVFISRDLDSRPSARELAALEEWLASEFILHIMRDHPGHGKTFLGGLWGSKLENKLMRQLWTGQWIKMLEDPLAYSDRSLKGPDEKLLDHYVWPWAQFLTLSHDSFYCDRFPNTVGFPTQRLNESNNFVGAIVYEFTNISDIVCPEKCRRKVDWLYC